MSETYTKEQILHALALQPCHTTGMHDPTHTGLYICELQKVKAFEGLLKLLNVEVGELPRQLHHDCGWCSDSGQTASFRNWVEKGPDQENLRKGLRERIKASPEREAYWRERYSQNGLIAKNAPKKRETSHV